MDKCQCVKPGYCETHRREMGEMQHFQCQNHAGYFELFQRMPRGLGDVVEIAFRKTGISSIVEKAKGEKCKGCKKRQEKLNELVPFKRKAK